MKKIPSYPKITAKTNITVTQTQSININSPKAGLLKKGFKNDHKKPKQHTQILRNQSSTTLLKPDHKTQDQHRKNSKKIMKDTDNERSIKNTKSQKELAMLSEKLKRLQEKIKLIKAKQKKQKHSSISNRSMSRNRQGSNYAKKQNVSSRKDLQVYKKLQRNQSVKILKKSYSDKIGIKLPQSTKNKGKKMVDSQLANIKSPENMKEEEKQEHEKEILHQFLTQVPNTHPDANLKQGVSQSLKNRTYEMSESQHDESDDDEAYYIGKAQKSLRKPNLFAIRQHIFQSLQTMQFLMNIRRPTVQEISKKSIPFSNKKFPYTIVLDLDETLIHCNESLHIPHDIKLTIKFPTNQKIDAGINIRPYAVQFLQQLAQFAEIVVFTASHECYANVVLDYLDPHKKLISKRLFRQHCWQTQQGIYIKDLRVLKNRSLDNMLLVDNAAYSYFFQLQNGIPIVPYYDEKKDKQLPILLTYIKEIFAICENQKITLREANSKYFRFDEYSKFQDAATLIEELYTKKEIIKQ